jgi:hypothetical protein
MLQSVFCEHTAITETCRLIRFMHIISVHFDSRTEFKYTMQDTERVLI